MSRLQRNLLFAGIFLGIALVLFLLFAPSNLISGGGNSSSGGNAGSSTTQANNSDSTSSNIEPGVCPPPLDTAQACLTPRTIRELYNIQPLMTNSLTGAGQTVVLIVSFGSPSLQQDMEIYDHAFVLPSAEIQIISPLQIPESDPHQSKGSWANLTTLEAEAVHAVAPEAKIVVLTSPVAETEGTTGLPEFRQLEQYAIDNQLGNIILQGWGISELTLQDQVGQQELQKWDSMFQQATKKGITFLASTGDNGATDYADANGKTLATEKTVCFPASSPWVTAVGGTTMAPTAQNQNTKQTERAWNGSGGGFSRIYQAPDYQKTSLTSAQMQGSNNRGIPDIAAMADPNTGLAMYRNGQWSMAGGTSASVAVWAAIVAIASQMAGHPLGFINPTLYTLASSDTYTQNFRDITDGNNTNQKAGVQGYPAAGGWDAVTGLGVPRAGTLLTNLVFSLSISKQVG